MLDIKIPIVYSTSHEVFPRIVLVILVILAIIIFLQYLLKTRKEKSKLFAIKGKHFFEKDYDKVKLFGSAILLLLYIVIMKPLGFIFASILIMSLFNILYSARFGKKDIGISIGISVIETMTVWFIFGYLFEITLP